MLETELKAYYYPNEITMVKEIEKEIEEKTKQKWIIQETRDRFYDTRERDLKEKGIDLRCRKQGEEVILTYKGPINITTGFKIREEIEVRVSDEEKIRKILKNVGFEITREIKKTRKTIRYNKLIITVDYFRKLGTVIELEGEPSKIREFAITIPKLSERLGPYSFKDVLERYKRYKTRNNKLGEEKRQ